MYISHLLLAQELSDDLRFSGLRYAITQLRRQGLDFCNGHTLKALGGVAVKSAGDYKSSEVRDLESGEITTTGQPSSDVLYYTLKNEDKIIVRPSGTEPKIKIYLLAHGDDQTSLDAKLAAYEKDSRKMTEV